MFYVLYENRHFLLDTWDEVRFGEDIDPYSELNIGLISHHEGFPLLNGEVSLIFIDDEEGLCGFAFLRPLDEDAGKEIPAWLLSDINLHIRDLISNNVERADRLKKRFYTALRDALMSIMHPIAVRNIYTMSHDIQEHENLKYYTQFNFIEEPQYTNGGVLGFVSCAKEAIVNLDVLHYCGTSPLFH